MPGKYTPIINILTAKLPRDLTIPIYNEYTERMKEVTFILEKGTRFRDLRNDIRTIELLLALTIFHKRVISCLDSAVKFYGRVTGRSNAHTISIGMYDLTQEERNKIWGAVISFNKLMNNYSIPIELMNYYLTRDFLANVQRLKFRTGDATDFEEIIPEEN